MEEEDEEVVASCKGDIRDTSVKYGMKQEEKSQVSRSAENITDEGGPTRGDAEGVGRKGWKGQRNGREMRKEVVKIKGGGDPASR